MQTPITLGLVGLGTIARNQHLPALAATPGLHLVAVASRNARHESLPNFHDIDALLAGAPDVAAITLCTPPQGRFVQAAAAIRAGKHVMLEKPPGASVSEVEALIRLAEAAGVTLYASWHSRAAAAVEEARGFLATTKIRRVEITWKEDVCKWHPGQEWIWQPGGLGVFDPGINALSILTQILPEGVYPTAAVLNYPANKAAPIAAEVTMESASAYPVQAVFDWRQTGPQTWDIRAETDAGELLMQDGGARLSIGGEARIVAQDQEYERLYAQFEQLIRTGQSDVDLAPLKLVADAFLLGERREVEPFFDRSIAP
ncbi:MAG: Gfo/Idh/MocA family oxidoreductase [Paracoccaceae bacterium]|nr:Gfo/Idh/MocA family oxidoreductase [Paracoccaceae bacterium]